METLLSPLQSDATSGVGKTLIVPEPERIVRFLIPSKGPPTRGEIQIQWQQDSWMKSELRTLATISVPTDLGVAFYDAGPVTGGNVTVTPLLAC